MLALGLWGVKTVPSALEFTPGGNGEYGEDGEDKVSLEDLRLGHAVVSRRRVENHKRQDPGITT